MFTETNVTITASPETIFTLHAVGIIHVGVCISEESQIGAHAKYDSQP